MIGDGFLRNLARINNASQSQPRPSRIETGLKRGRRSDRVLRDNLEENM